MTAIWSSIFILILFLLRKYTRERSFYSVAPLTVLLTGCIFRCILPLDFPGFTQPISSTSVYAAINTALYTPYIRFETPNKGITPLMTFFVIWIGVSLGMLGRFLWNYGKKIHALTHIYTEITSGPIYEMAQEVSEQLSIKKFQVLQDESILVPHVCGFLHPRVMLPVIAFTTADLRHILMHELQHWKNGDMWMRLLTNFTCYLFWWNPLVYLLHYRLEESLELKCDGSLVANGCLSDEARIEYLDSIQRVILNKLEHKASIREFGNRLFNVESDLVAGSISKLDFQQRLDVIGDYVPDKKKERRLFIFAVAATTIMIVFSYRYILQPGYYVPDEYTLAGGIKLSPENAYLIKESDGCFSLYVDEEFYLKTTPKGAQLFLDMGFEIIDRKNKIEARDYK